MVLVCFVLDLRNISPSLIGDLKQLKVAYTPSGNFCLRDFHHAVNSLPMDAFVPEIDESGAISCRDLKLSSVLCDRAMYSWGGRDIMRKVIVLSSCFPEDMDSEARNTLMDAADKCVSVEFLLLDKRASHLSYTQEKTNRFLRCLSDLDNCSFQTCIPDGKSLRGLENKWLQDLKDDSGESLQVQFIFKRNLVGSVNKIVCNLSAATNQIVDGFKPCQTCRCHGIPVRDSVEITTEKLQCSVTNHDLGKYDVIESSVKVGERTVLFLPSVDSLQKLHPISSQIDFTVIERTNLTSINEGIIIGRPYIVNPSTCHEAEDSSEEMDQPDLNTQIFQGLCGALYSMDQGLVCSSDCNLDTRQVVEFHCYYILQPSENGPMLLRRLAGSEEVLPTSSSVSQFAGSSIPREVEISVKGALLEIESKDYNPLTHNRGFHQKLNLIVKESLQFGSLHSNLDDATCEVSSAVSDPVVSMAQTFQCITNPHREEETRQEIQITDEEDKATASITKEWEQLVVTEVRMKSPSPVLTTPKPNTNRPFLSPNNKQADMKTSMILERLEAPRKMRGKVGSPSVVVTSSQTSPDVSVLSQKKPLIPFQTSQVSNHQTTSSSQLMKPSFQRLKRKHK
ncbi:uncharacterized protein LOC106446076 isoform X2 [Brassica napus]|uniref:uncharacterized protein LOC106318707 isoform X3 n=1 Tax=Brassica oleracea var. oleracea TaxID=109376 RepID=UPI0006A6DE94|nr:PREDICTED: uncharacterized protein LOC106318707 isoform X3 [Brassica oleracea var. oleracea]XP_048623158.1 uncharacterized protein LOC106446076 isoform X2 [Brassica napus]